MARKNNRLKIIIHISQRRDPCYLWIQSRPIKREGSGVGMGRPSFSAQRSGWAGGSWSPPFWTSSLQPQILGPQQGGPQQPSSINLEIKLCGKLSPNYVMADHESQMGLYPGDKTFQFLHPIRNVYCYQSWQERPMCITKDAGNPQPMLMTQKEFFFKYQCLGPQL